MIGLLASLEPKDVLTLLGTIVGVAFGGGGLIALFTVRQDKRGKRATADGIIVDNAEQLVALQEAQVKRLVADVDRVEAKLGVAQTEIDRLVSRLRSETARADQAERDRDRWRDRYRSATGAPPP